MQTKKLLMLPFLLLIGCVTNTEEIDLPSSELSYAGDIQPILSQNCNNCHGAGQNNFNSSSYAAVMASVSPANTYNRNQVVPGDADASPLVDKIEPNPEFGGRMPVGGSLSSAEINAIRTWINEGALNN